VGPRKITARKSGGLQWLISSDPGLAGMSAFGGKADITRRKYPLLQSQLGVKRT
jgi:hypothetical protein